MLMSNGAATSWRGAHVVMAKSVGQKHKLDLRSGLYLCGVVKQALQDGKMMNRE